MNEKLILRFKTFKNKAFKNYLLIVIVIVIVMKLRLDEDHHHQCWIQHLSSALV